MKKNKMMRIASVLLVAVLISTCAISGTFAKYVTKTEGTDTARVAKWGVLLSIEGTGAFDTKYAADDAGYVAAGGEYSVVSSNDDKVVAPGTNSDQIEKTLTATVTGQPEVAARYAITGTVEDIVLPKGTYTDYTKLVKSVDNEGVASYGYTDTFTLAEDYAPVQWNLLISKNGANEINVADKLYEVLADYPELLAKAEAYGFSEKGCSFFAAVEILKKVASNGAYEKIVDKALGKVVSGGRNFQLEVTDDGVFTLSYDFDAGKEMGFEFTLSWEWAFEQVEAADATAGLTEAEAAELAIYDAADTYLGNIAAAIDGIVIPEGANITIGATLTASATQID